MVLSNLHFQCTLKMSEGQEENRDEADPEGS